MSKIDLNAVLKCLAEWFPQTFTFEKYLPHRPLKIGINADLLERCPALSVRECGAALRCYTSRLMYLESLVEGADRVDLDGAPVGTVTADQARWAAVRITGIVAEREAELTSAAAAYSRKQIPKPAAAKVEPAPPAPPAPPKRLGLADLKEAAARRRAMQAAE